MSHIFISYSRRDIDFAQKIVDALAASNLDTWIDWKSIPKGEDWEEEIYRGIEGADVFLFLISPDSVTSEMCKKEIAHAVTNGKRILPIVIRDTRTTSVHPEISKRNWIFCREGQSDFDKSVEEICKTIHTDYEWLRFHTELQVKALRWEKKRDTSRLLRGKELQDAEQYIADIGNLANPQPTTLQRQYLLYSRQNADHMARILTGTSIGVAAIMIVLALVAWGQRNVAVAERNVRATAQANEQIARETAEANEKRAEEQATIALARQLAAQAELLNAAEHKLETSALLAVLSLQTYPNNEASLFLQRHLDLLARPVTNFALVGDVAELQLSLDGDFLFVTTRDRSVQMVDLRNGQKLHEVHVDFDIERIIQSRNAQRLIIQGGPILSVWDITTGAHLAQFEQTYWNTKEMVVSSDFDWAAAIDPNNHSDLLVYSSNSQEPIRRSYTAPITSLAISLDDSRLAIALEDSSIRILEHKSTVAQWDATLEGPARKIVFSPDGLSIALLLNDDKILVLQASNGAVLYQLSGQGEKYSESLSYSSDGKKLIVANQGIVINGVFGRESGANENRVKIIDTANWKRVAQINAPTDGSIVYHLNGKLAAMFGREWVYIVDLRQGIVLKKIQNNYDVENVVWDPSDAPRWISTIPWRSNCEYEVCVPAIRVWDLDTLQEVKRIGEGYSLTYAYSGQGWAAAWDANSGNVHVWSMFPEQTIGLTDDTFISSAPGGDVRFSADGNWLAARAGDLNVYQITTFPNPNQAANSLAFVIRDSAVSFSFDPSSRFIATLDQEGMVKLWDLFSGKVVSEIQGNASMVEYSMDGRLLALMEKGGSIQVYNSQTGRKEKDLEPSVQINDKMFPMAFNHDGSVIISSNGDGNRSIVTQWDVASGRKMAEEQYAGNVFGLEYNSTGKILSLSIEMAEETVCVLADDLHRKITLGVSVYCGDFSPDGRYLLQTSENSVFVWDTELNSYTKHLDHIGAVRQAMFSGDGEYILSTSFDGRTRIWDFDSGAAIAEAWQPDVLAYSADINPVDGRIAMMGAYNHVLRLVYWQPEILMSYACDRVTRNLASYEWTQYTGDALPYQAVCPNLPIEPEVIITPAP